LTKEDDVPGMPFRAETGRATTKTHMRYVMDDGVAARVRIGLVALAGNQISEYEFRRMLAIEGVAFYTSRVKDSIHVTPDMLRETQSYIAEAAALVLPGIPLDVIAFTCTSAAMVNGEDTIFAKIREARPDVPCTTPITGALAAMAHLKLKRIALLTPYVQEINEMMRAYIEARGVAVPVMGSFNNGNDNEVARISQDSVRTAVKDLASGQAVDGVFASCGSLRIVDIAETLEADIDRPVFSSNTALAWHALRLGGYKEPISGFGCLLRS
jgi:maleate isomerase